MYYMYLSSQETWYLWDISQRELLAATLLQQGRISAGAPKGWRMLGG